MTMISSSHRASLRSPAMSGGLVRWIGPGRSPLAAYWERRAAIRALLERDDRELRDIGLRAQPDRGGGRRRLQSGHGTDAQAL